MIIAQRLTVLYDVVNRVWSGSVQFFRARAAFDPLFPCHRWTHFRSHFEVSKSVSTEPKSIIQDPDFTYLWRYTSDAQFT